jgi:glutathione S-transferase
MTGKINRSSERQTAVDRACQTLTLYDFKFSPFCAKVRRVIQELNLKIELKVCNKHTGMGRELKNGGGMFQVPCLRITEGDKVRWMYESEDIKAYLRERFSS